MDSLGRRRSWFGGVAWVTPHVNRNLILIHLNDGNCDVTFSFHTDDPSSVIPPSRTPSSELLMNFSYELSLPTHQHVNLPRIRGYKLVNSLRNESVNKLSSLAPPLSYVALEHKHTQHKNQFLTAQPSLASPKKRSFFCENIATVLWRAQDLAESQQPLPTSSRHSWTVILRLFWPFYLSLIFFFSEILAFLIKLSCDGEWKHSNLHTPPNSAQWLIAFGE